MSFKKVIRRTLKVTAATFGGLLALALLLLALLPYLAPFLPLPALNVDLSESLTGDAARWVTNRTATARLELSRAPRGGLLMKARGQLLDWPYTLTVDADWSIFGLCADARWTFAIDGATWQANGSVSGTPRTWRASVQIPAATIDQDDPVLAAFLAHMSDAVSDLSFATTLELHATAEKTRELPVPVWSAKGKLAKAVVAARLDDSTLAVDGLQLAFGADGIANRVTLAPLLPHAQRIEFGNLSLTNVYAAIRLTEKVLLVNEAGADFCGGNVRLYSLFLDPQQLTSGFTVFLDNVDAGQVLRQVKGFRGEATGRLHGKLPLFLKNGRELRLKDAYLYSTPGETGSIRVSDPEPILENLALGGVDEETRANMARALANLLYTVLKIDLRRVTDGELALGLKIEGSSTHRGKTVPVNVSITFRGELEQILNLGLKTSLGQ